jgi:hypothetical protein
MAFFYTHKEALAALKRNADILDELRRYNCLCSVFFGIADACGGYGWHTTMQVELTIVGEACEKCEACGCTYDTTLPPKFWNPAEHRHRWRKSERNVGLWDGYESKGLRKFLKQCLKTLKEQ